jgi:hypothetical protein
MKIIYFTCDIDILVINLFYITFQKINRKDEFKNMYFNMMNVYKSMIISKLTTEAGFFSQFFFMVNHYIHCKKHNITFKLDSTNWLYKYSKGWTDYFIDIDFNGNNAAKFRSSHPGNFLFSFNKSSVEPVNYIEHGGLFEDFPWYEYINALKNIYIYNEKTKRIIDTTIENYFFGEGSPYQKTSDENEKEYDAIFIRRGDKLIFETNYISGEKYLELLIEKNPNCKNVYLQTDDYNSFIEIQDYINKNNLNINLFTRCSPNVHGHLIKKCLSNVEIHNFKTSDATRKYYEKVENSIRTSKSLEEMSPEEKYEHTIEFLTGVEIILNAEHCVLDKQSNVSRFIWMFNKDPSKVYDVLNPTEMINMNNTKCPAFL